MGRARSLDGRSVTILGAGIAGLTAAYRLRRLGAKVQVLEAADRCGGPMHSVRVDGRLFELGPTTVPSTAPNLGQLIDDLGLRKDVHLSRPVAGRRLIWRRGKLHALPEKPPQLLTCSALGLFSKLRLLAEPLIPKRRSGEPETLRSFGNRRLGPGAVAAFLDPFIIGIFAGQLDQLGVDAIPRLVEWESQYGSLFRAAIAQRREHQAESADSADADADERRPGPPPLISFPDGLGTLPKTLSQKLEGMVATGCRATAIEDRGSGFRVHTHEAEGDRVRDTDAVVVATPAHSAGQLLAPYLPSGLRTAFEEIAHPFVATVGLVFRRDEVDHPLDAFGLLVASDSRLPSEADILGMLFQSSIFSGRAGEDEVILTAMIGGSRDPVAASLDDQALIARATLAAHKVLGAHGEPMAARVARWPRAIPQYPPGHLARVAELRRHLAQRGRLAVAGNYLDGVGVEGAVASAVAAADFIEKSMGTNLT